jgi:3-methyladenine DNA glycosylase/8-oxoguanine DNA glycosylase
MTYTMKLPLVGAGGEPVDLWRTIDSHGLTALPPMRPDPVTRSLEATLPLDGRRPRVVRLSAGEPGSAHIEVVGRAPGAGETKAITEAVRHMLRLDEDLSPFYERVRDDPELAWAATGAGRMIRSPTAFEEVVKTICTTNCAWSATERMIGALVEHLGETAAGAPPAGPYGRSFPTPTAMARVDEAFYRDVVRAGYRGRYLAELAGQAAGGVLDLEAFRAPPEELPDEELERRLLALPGVGPYAAAHVMLMLGRYSRLILDSWTRPTYARLSGGRPVRDATILRRFRRYGPYAGLAFWLVLTRDWV